MHVMEKNSTLDSGKVMAQKKCLSLLYVAMYLSIPQSEADSSLQEYMYH